MTDIEVTDADRAAAAAGMKKTICPKCYDRATCGERLRADCFRELSEHIARAMAPERAEAAKVEARAERMEDAAERLERVRDIAAQSDERNAQSCLHEIYRIAMRMGE